MIAVASARVAATISGVSEFGQHVPAPGSGAARRPSERAAMT